jgi:hypothetical protein
MTENSNEPSEGSAKKENEAESECDEESLDEIEVGQIDSLTGEAILYIVFSAADFIVSIDENLSLNWQTTASYSRYAADFGEVVGSCELSDALVDRIFTDKENRLAYKKMLGSVISRILDDGNSISARKQLAIVDERINEHGKEKVRTAYIVSAITTVVVVGGLLVVLLVFQKYLARFGLEHFRHTILICSLLGGVGSFITTFARFEKYEGSLVAGLSIHRLDGFLRVFYGLIAGLLIILAIRADVLVGFANKNQDILPWLYYFLAMAAGASEIIIPNLIQQTEGELGIKKLEKKEEKIKADEEAGKR